MKIDEIPQDNDPSYHGQKKLCYAVDESGRIVQGHSSGWQTEETVKSVAWNVIHKDLDQTRRRVVSGKTSPLMYYMKRRQMDPGLLAQNMGISALRVRLHLKPFFFRRLSREWLARYADCLEISKDTLQNYQGGDDGIADG